MRAELLFKRVGNGRKSPGSPHGSGKGLCTRGGDASSGQSFAKLRFGESLARRLQDRTVPTMSLEAKIQEIEEEYRLLPDAQERFQYLIDQSVSADGLDATAQIEANRVKGCVSRVWVVGREENQQWHFTSDADAPVVKGLAWLLCRFYSGACAS